jgi:hypothetical protein
VKASEKSAKAAAKSTKTAGMTASKKKPVRKAAQEGEEKNQKTRTAKA